jgi:type I protein arginine methyltransferase
MDKPKGYRITGYGDMIADRQRMRAYAQALEQAVFPGSNVLDIGAGTGIFSLLACRFGASRVDAVEPDDSIHLARRLAEVNGYADRIRFHQEISTRLDLPQRADVIVSDLRGILPLFQWHLPSIFDARHRLLAADGVLIPKRDRLWATLLESPELYQHYVGPWQTNDFGLDLTPGQPLAANTWHKINAKADEVLLPPQEWAVLDYASILDANVQGRLGWTAERPGTAHGVVLWFDAELAEGITFSNAPGEPALIYGQAFFPLQAPVKLATGDSITLKLRADLIGDDYVWQWQTSVQDGREGDSIKAEFRQSTFFGVPVSPAELRKRANAYRPALCDDGEVDRFILAQIDGNATLDEIALVTVEAFPERFRDARAALARAGDLSVKYSR